MGCVGDDEYGRTLKKCCDEGGVNAHYMVDKATPTGTCACLIKDSERTLITNLGAANNYNKEHLESEESLKLVNAAKVIYSAGFFLTSGGPPCTKFLGQKCSDEGKLYCLNLSAPFICQFFTAQLDETMPFVDIVFANETEAAGLGKKRGWGEDVSAVALKVASLPKASGTRPRIVVFTQGSDSTVVACGGVVTTYAVEALDKEKLVDTNGAGDAFVGGFLAGLLQGKDTAACVGAGHYAAREVIQKSGCCFPEKSLFTFA